jgi:hypothetical protein
VVPVQQLNPHIDSYAHEFAYGSADGKTVIFQSVDALAAGAPNDSTQKAYRYDVATDAVSYLPGVGGSTVLAASDDDRRFLFGDSTHIAVWDEGTIKTLASVALSYGQALVPARATASGSVFLFSTQGLIPGFNSGGMNQVYRYDLAQDKLSCVSCPPDGIVPSGDARLTNDDLLSPQPDGALVADRGMSDDGRRVFFDTPDALVPRDANGRRDVYEWTPSGVSLISSGRSQQNSFLLDSGASGNDVFFATAEDLVPGDTDSSYDVYDARVNGGFKKVEAAAPCAGDGCQGSMSEALSLPTPASVGFSGAGNEQSAGATTRSAAPVGPKLGSHRLTGSTLELTVGIARPGRLTVSGEGLRTFTRSFARTGSFKIRVALTRRAERPLKGRRRLRLAVRVSFTPMSGAASSVKFVLNTKA